MERQKLFNEEYEKLSNKQKLKFMEKYFNSLLKIHIKEVRDDVFIDMLDKLKKIRKGIN